jgi:DNA repair protein RadA/Sms
MAPKKTAAARPNHRCRECGWTSAKWVGRCGECQAWGTVEEAGTAAVASALAKASATGVARSRAVPIAEVSADRTARGRTGIGELDRVLGGGLVTDAVVLLAGEPGVGKSTLLLHMAAKLAAEGRRVLYVSGEESTGQVRLRAERMQALADTLFLAAETDLGAVLAQIENIEPDVVIVDSVQTISTDAVEGTAGGVAQVRTVTAVLTQLAKAQGRAMVLVGHVTKDGAVAGPRTMEHIVDVVLTFEGDRHTSLRLLRAAKNRFGAVDEVGCFELDDRGIAEIVDPSGIFLTERTTPTPGTAVTVALEGRRPLVAEVQALIAGPGSQTARRVTSGLDSSRVAMIAAVLDRRADVRIGLADLFAATIGGVRLAEPAADLAVALALATASNESSAPLGLVVMGEIGLAGDIRNVPAVPRRLREAARLGFTCAIVPASSEATASDHGLEVAAVTTLPEALRAMGNLWRRHGTTAIRIPRHNAEPGADGEVIRLPGAALLQHEAHRF